MIWKKISLFFVVGIVAIIILIYCSASIPGIFLKNVLVQSQPAPTYPSDNISAIVNTPRGTMIIHASVPESLAVMPVYRLNMSERHTLTVNRIPLFSDTSKNNTPNRKMIPSVISDTKEVKALAEKFLQKYHGLPDDIVIWKALELGGTWGGETPTELSPYEISGPYTRIIYTRIINGQPVDNWGINHEEFLPGEYGNMGGDHDFTIVGLWKDGDLIFIIERWTKSEYIRDEPVISAGEALDRIKRWENAREDYGSIDDLQVQTVRQGYFEDTGYTSIIEPAWFFSGINRDGHDQTVVVLARKNDSSILPFYNWSHQDPSIPDEWADRKNYETWIKEHYVNGTMSMEKVTDIVKKFSGNPNLVIENTIPVKEERGCGTSSTIYNITTNEGVYTIDPRISVVRSVSYPVNVAHTLPNPVDYPQILKISADYVHGMFGKNSTEDLERNPHITEDPGAYRVRIPTVNMTILLDIDKKTGDVIGYTNANALPWIIC